MTDNASKIADSVVDGATSAASRARDLAADTADTVLATGENWLEALSDQIVRRPLTSAGIAIAVGFVLSRLVGRRHQVFDAACPSL